MSTAPAYLEYEREIREYIVNNISKALKKPHSFIHYPFIDPGSVYDGNVWDWDTFWVTYGLLHMLEAFDSDFREKIILHAKGNVLNFLDHQLEDGYIPMMIEVADWPEPYLNMRHKEGVLMNMHKPFLCQQIRLISNCIGSYEWIAPFEQKLREYFACYRRNYYMEEKGLYVWCDDIMIGMDNDPASFGRPKFSTANIYLNSFMVEELQSMVDILTFLRKDGAELYKNEKNALIEAIQEECWDKRDEFFYSVDVDVKTRQYDWFHQGLGVFWKTLPIKVMTWSGFIPLWVGFASEEQAKAMMEHYKDEGLFHSDFGVTTLAKDEKMFSLEATNNPSNWLGGIWLVSNYIVFRGLLNYGYVDEAKEICHNTLKLLGEDLKNTGCMHEYYNPFTGKPVMNGGFINWNILALTMISDLKDFGLDN